MDGLVSESENESSILGPSASSLPPDPFLRPMDFIQPWNFHLLSALMFLVTALSLSENFTVILVTVKFKQLRQPVNYVIVNLSVADFLVSLIGGTISFLTNMKGYFYMGRWACVLEGFAVTFFGLVQIPVSMYQTVVTSLAQGNGPVQVAMAPVAARITDSTVTMDGQAVEVVTLEQ